MDFQSQLPMSMPQYPLDHMMIDDTDASVSLHSYSYSYTGKHPYDLNARYRYNEALDSPSPPSADEISDTETETATEIVEETEGKRAPAPPSRLKVNFTTPIDGFDPLQRRLARLPHRIRRRVLHFLSLYDIFIQYALYPTQESGIQGAHDALPVVLLVAREDVPVSKWKKGVKRVYEYLVDLKGFPAIEIPVPGQEARSEDGLEERISSECKVYLAKLSS